MVKKKHKQYRIEDLEENKDTAIGVNRMVDPHVNPNADKFDYDLKHGINSRQQRGKKRWTVSAYDYGDPEKSKTPPITISELKTLIKEALSAEFMANREKEKRLMASLKKRWELVDQYWKSSKTNKVETTDDALESASVGDWFYFRGGAVRIFAKKSGKIIFDGIAPHGYPLNHPDNWKIMTPQQIEASNTAYNKSMEDYVKSTPEKMD